ncbi:tripartite tricarboxylate transporter substrate binding protein [Ensifer sp. ENS07]|uniref:Bug family tripartite tricarboxylate transporter substrate binding protein n=1 Tax=Ensifer sp. ENS07 TaxID=2769274 RepID=UPI00177D992B|nr:tripartite tricarboxylate transporter substrate binding protein [Ensifer sp. ENS07]MBD9638811.1 tripartite tricarboxylate transporter substrate binding protein [Ensifer sp. ENS07]
MTFRILAIKGLALLGLLCTTNSAAFADAAFPSRPIRIIVPTAPGGTLDLTTRLYAQKMGEDLGQPVIVENRPGGDTIPGTLAVKDAAADGYTLLAQAEGLLMVPQLRVEQPFEPLKDFTGVGLMARFPFVMVVGGDQPDRTLADFIARAKENSGKLTYASAGVATPPHVVAPMFLKAAGLELLHVPYKGNGAALPDVVAGRVDMIFDGYISSSSFLKAGKLRAIGIAGPKRTTPLPDVPTLMEAGVEFGPLSWLGIVAPAGTPDDAIARLWEALVRASKDPALSERVRADGSEPASETAAEFNAFLTTEYKRMSDAITTLNLEKK